MISGARNGSDRVFWIERSVLPSRKASDSKVWRGSDRSSSTQRCAPRSAPATSTAKGGRAKSWPRPAGDGAAARDRSSRRRAVHRPHIQTESRPGHQRHSPTQPDAPATVEWAAAALGGDLLRHSNLVSVVEIPV